MAAYSTIDALSSLCTSVPDWSRRLDELNGQIALRQMELARLEEGRENRPSTARSLRNKGSTESLRPKNCDKKCFLSEEADKLTSDAPVQTPKPIQNGVHPPRPRCALGEALNPPLSHPSPKAPPGAGLSRQSSQPTPPTRPRFSPGVLRKRKTESLASGESVAPKYRTRSMIIVYYDSAVQTAFEELVKFVSTSRNSMRKGKMAAKMAEMRRAAELEVQADDDEAEGQLNNVVTGSLLAAPMKVAIGKAGESLVVSDSEANDAGELSMTKLRYVSTRNMGPSKNYPRADNMGSTFSVGFLRGYGSRGKDSAPDIFDELDNGLQWCQSQCEHAAHQFLRDGDCSQEIEGIKRRLLDVKGTAEKEIERLKKEEAETTVKPVRKAVSANGKSRELKSVQRRKDLGTVKDLEVDDDTMSVDDDDEGISDMEPPKLFFKRSREVGL